MENLILYNQNHVKHSEIPNKHSCFEVNRGVYILSKSPDNLLLTHEKDGDNNTIDLKVPASELISNLDYIEFEQLLFIATRSKVLLVSLNLSKVEHIEFDQDVLAVKWSSTQEYFVAIYEDGNVGCYNIIYDVPFLEQIAVGNPNSQPIHIDVGWGSSDTQFQGKTVKASEYKSEYKSNITTPVIDWRENGEMFVVNYHEDEGRKLKVYTKNCELIYLSKPSTLPGLEHPIAFRPNGRSIAFIVSQDGLNQKLILIERNGTIQQTIDLESVKVCEIQWSSCGQCLCIWQCNEDKSWLDLYLCTSMTWFVKQRLCFNTRKNQLTNFNIIPFVQNAILLQLFFKEGLYEYKFIKQITRSNKFDNDIGLTCSIRGKSIVKFYYADRIEPPDTTNEDRIITHENYITTIIFSPHNYHLAIVDVDNYVTIYNYEDKFDWKKSLQFKLDDLNLNVPFGYHCFYFTHDDKFIAISKQTKKTYDLKQNVSLESTIADPNILLGTYIQNSNNLIEVKTDISPIPVIELFAFKLEETTFTIYLTAVGTLYINNDLIQGNFTSMHYRDKHIFLTSTKENSDFKEINDFLLCLELNATNFLKLINGTDIFKLSYVRYVEKGSTIVNSISDTANIILQLPRGNVECVLIRSIQIQILHKLITETKFKEAVDIIKFQSLPLDLLFDLNPGVFLNNLRKVYTDIENDAILIKFLVGLKNTSTLNEYDLKMVRTETFNDKRFVVCSALLQVLLSLDPPQDALPIIAIAGICLSRNEYNVDKSLRLIASVCQTNYKEYWNEVEAAISAVSTYVPYKTLYKVALGLYDIDLCEIIAQKANMDPQYYRPFLTELRSQNPVKARFTICNALNRTDAAAVYYLEMYRQKDIEATAILNYAIEKNCCKVLYEYINQKDEEIFRSISSFYVKQLVKEGAYRKAGSILIKSKSYHEAVKVLLKGDHWQEAVAAVYQGNESPNQKVEQFCKIASYLKDNKKYKEASSVYLDHCKEIDLGLECLLKAHCYEEAYHKLFNLKVESSWSGFIQNDIIPDLEKYIEELDDKVNNHVEKFNEKFNRLKEWRKNKQLESDVRFDNGADPRDIDSFSDTESVSRISSAATSTSRSTCRKTQKEEKKFKNAKAGSKYEDIALIAQLHDIIVDTFKICGEINDKYSFLNEIQKEENPYQLKTLYVRITDIQKFMLDVLDEIWPTSLKRFDPKPEEKEFINITFLDPKYRTKPEGLIMKQTLNHILPTSTL